MTKLKTPLLSLDAHGTVGDAVTFQSSPKRKFSREKPVLPYSLTLPQQYQRWLYEDYAYRWTVQSVATKQEYASAGVRFHLTGFQYWMKYNLTNLPDIVGMWHLDTYPGPVGKDFSRNAHHATVFGASPADGLIDGGLSFILNDYIAITTQDFNFTSGDFSFETFAFIHSFTVYQAIFIRGLANTDGYEFYVDSTGRLTFRSNQAAANQRIRSAAGAIVLNTWYHLCFSKSDTNVLLYANAVDISPAVPTIIDPLTSTRVARMGIRDDLVNWPLDGILDHPILRNRTLDQTEITRHSERRYSL